MVALERELYEAKDSAISRALDFAEELMIELGVHETIKSLQDLPAQVAKAQAAVNAARLALDSHKAGALAGAKERYDLALLEAMLEAPQDAKNAEGRKMQLDAYLAGQSAAAADVRLAAQALHVQEAETRRLEGNLAYAEADLDQAKNRLRAMLAVAGLQEAVIKATRVS